MGLLRWLAFGSLLEAGLLAACFLIPFSHLWGQLPPPPAPSPSAEASGTSPDLSSALAIGLIFALPSLAPFALLARTTTYSLEDRVRLRPPLMAVAAGLILLPACVSLATYPCCTSDVLDYVNRQRLWVVYGGNPFTLVPNDHPEDWSYSFANFRDLVFGYGPLWWLLARAATQWATSLDEYLLGFKALSALSFALSAALIWRLADARYRLLSLAFFAWNPAVLIEGLVRTQNDLLTVPCALAAVWLFRRGNGGAAVLLSALGALVKVTVAPLGLVLAWSLLRARRWRVLVAGLVGSALVAVALYAPFWIGLGTFASLLAQANRAQWSAGSLLLLITGPLLGSFAGLLVRVVLGTVCVGLIGVYLRHVRKTAPPLADSASLVMLIGLLTLPMAFYSHYLMPVVALAAIASDARLRVLVLAVGLGAMVNVVLGVDTFAGGPTGLFLDVTGSVVLIAALVAGLLVVLRQAPPTASMAAAA